MQFYRIIKIALKSHFDSDYNALNFFKLKKENVFLIQHP